MDVLQQIPTDYKLTWRLLSGAGEDIRVLNLECCYKCSHLWS